MRDKNTPLQPVCKWDRAGNAIMTYDVFYDLYSKAESSDDREAFVASAPEYGADDLESIWELAHMSMCDFCNAAGGQTDVPNAPRIPGR